MFDVNKLKEFKFVLDEGFVLGKDLYDEETNELMFRNYITISFEEGNYIFYHDSEEKGELEIIEKDFDTFCQKVAAAVLEVQE